MEKGDTMKFSFLKEKITPESPVMQAGFSARTHKSEGVYDDPYASVILMQADETVIIIALDLCFGDKSFAAGIKEAVNKKYGLAQDKVIINYSHTHSVVAAVGGDKEEGRPYGRGKEGIGHDLQKDEADHDLGKEDADTDIEEKIRYSDSVRDKIMDMLDEGFGNLIEGNIYILKGESKFGVSRRFPSGGKILWKPNFDENCMDKDLFLLKFVDKDGEIRGLIYSYACHPTTLGPDNYLISADFPGAVRRILEEKYPGMTPVFLQGCGADIKPYITAGDGGRFKSCNFDELEQAGNYLANDIQKYMERPGWRKINAKFKTEDCNVKLYNEIWAAAKWKEIAEDPDEPPYMKQSAVKMLMSFKESPDDNFLPFYISLFRLDKQTCFVCLECEIVSEMGKEIKQLFNEDVIVLGYTNSRSCYIPTRRVSLEGGYESMSFVPALLRGPFVPETEDIIVGRSALMVKNILRGV